MTLRLSPGARVMVAMFSFVVALAVVSQALDHTGAVDLAVTPGSPDVILSVNISGQQAIIDIFSPKGIGSAGVDITSSARPTSVTMRFHLGGLEDLRFTYASSTIEASLSSLNGRDVSETVRTGNASAAPQEISPGSGYWMPMTIVGPETPAAEQGAYIEVQAPADFIKGQHKTFTMDWVDFYR